MLVSMKLAEQIYFWNMISRPSNPTQVIQNFTREMEDNRNLVTKDLGKRYTLVGCDLWLVKFNCDGDWNRYGTLLHNVEGFFETPMTDESKNEDWNAWWFSCRNMGHVDRFVINIETHSWSTQWYQPMRKWNVLNPLSIQTIIVYGKILKFGCRSWIEKF